MSTFSKFNIYVEDLSKGKHNFDGTHQYKVMLTNTAPNATDAVKADIAEIAVGNGYAAGGANMTIVSATQTSGVLKVIVSDLTIQASGGSIGPFRYAVVYNDTQTSPVKPLIGWSDYQATITLAAGESILIDFDGTSGFLVVT